MNTFWQHKMSPHQITDASGTRTQTYHAVTGGLDLVSYDSGGLLSSREVDYTWDTSLRPAGYGVSSGGPASLLAYDDAGRLLSVAAAGATHTNGYIPGTNTLSSLTTTAGSSTVLNRTLYHDRMQRLLGIETKNGSGSTLSRHGYKLDGAGRRTRATRENGQRWDYGYDPLGQVTSAVKKFPDSAAIPGHTFSYQFDGIGNRTSAVQGGTGTAVTYPASQTNALNQYTSIVTEGGRFILGEAPAANEVTINGNVASRAGGLGFYWKQFTGDNSSAPLWSSDTVASNGISISGNTWTPKETVTPVHDFDGNLTFDGRWDYSWDAENRLTRMETTTAAANAGVPRQRLDFVYDSQGRRVSKTVSTSTNGTTWTFASNQRFLYDRWNLVAEYSAPSESSTSLTLQASHTWGIDLSGMIQGAGGVGGLLCTSLTSQPTALNCYPGFDGNGNISAWIDGSGALLGRMDYSPFGQLIAQYKFTGDTTLSRLNFGFSTKFTDAETGLLYYGYRYYDPVPGGWLSKDLIEEQGGINLYGFVMNDGVNWVDYLGNKIITDQPKDYRQKISSALEAVTGAKLNWACEELVGLEIKDYDEKDSWTLTVVTPGSGKTWTDLSQGLQKNPVIYLRNNDVTDNASSAAAGDPRPLSISANAKTRVPMDTGAVDGDNDPIYQIQDQPFEMLLWHELAGHAILQLKHPKQRWNTYSYKSNKSVKQSKEWKAGDPAITVENEAGARLNPTKKRRPQYYDTNDQWN